ncbi:reverse gyrase [Ignisphaera sp. 4213-co]|uniref:Reverse gyrase n=1 Tax=Ignisphaera cupida TaxID=3050454 RepID=A0ABD4Z6G0_9CREN|nr:reverse gyrase [Ignisphaera sp. 4213-co]MDK6028572.1 reverse gyrase [Ignisphaera sp. 4213-co]
MIEYRNGFSNYCRQLNELGSKAVVVCIRKDSTSSFFEDLKNVIEKEIVFFKDFFKQCTGYEMRSFQEYWSKKLLFGESFALVAPTGVGKSTLLTVYALYKTLFYNSKVYMIAPTREIAKQLHRKIVSYVENIKDLGYDVKKIKILLYDSTARNSEEVKNSIMNGDFNVLITSAAFLSRHHMLIMDKKVDVIIADDLDSILRNSKNVDRVLHLLGFDDEIIEIGLQLVKMRQKMLVAKISKGLEYVDEIRKEMLELEASLKDKLSKVTTQLVVASATGRSKGIKALLLKELLGFDAGAVFEYLRNVDDVYIDLNRIDEIVDIVKTIGSGVIFVSNLYKNFVDKLTDLLSRNNIRFAIAKSGNKAVDKFRKGEVDVLIGSASYYGILVRGLDEPQRIRFAVFIGVPHTMKKLDDALNNVRFMFILLKTLKNYGLNVDEDLKRVVNIIQNSTPAQLILYSKMLRGILEPQQNVHGVVDNVNILKIVKNKLVSIVKHLLDKQSHILVENYGIIVKDDNGQIQVVKPDLFTYIQASGRTSRIVGKSKCYGVSIVFEKYHELVKILERRLKKITLFNGFRGYSKEFIYEAFKKIVQSRAEGGSADGIQIENIKPILIVVESPTKARTIASMFGKPVKKIYGNIIVYETVIPLEDRVFVAMVTATLGHLTDLVVDEGFHGVKELGSGGYAAIYDFITKCRNCGAQHVGAFDSCPYCNSFDVYTSASIYNVLKKLASEVSAVFIATDPDTEGEKIAFDVYNLIYSYNQNIYRIEFREVTKNAILSALKNPRKIDLNKVLAQITRRIADRWIGFELSMYLQNMFNKPWLGAGRVQSPVLLWTVNRYVEYKANQGHAIVVTILGYKHKLFLGSIDKAKAEEIARRIYEKGVRIADVKYEEIVLNPPPPYTTDTLLAEANMLYGFSASKTMSLAQNLFEMGLITYHRTDSTRISSIGMAIAREALEKMNLSAFYMPRSWDRNIRGEDAHEAIRPTTPLNSEEVVEAIMRGELGFATRISHDHLKLYDLIYRRFLASQIVPAKVLYATIVMDFDGIIQTISLPVDIIEQGFTFAYPIKIYNQFRKLSAGTIIKIDHVEVIKTSSVRLYKVSDLVSMMKSHGIGRPSTYAKAIDNNVRHGYMILSKKKKVAIPTKLGLDVADILSREFLNLVGIEFTRNLEKLIDEVEKGSIDIKDALAFIKSRVDEIWIKTHDNHLTHLTQFDLISTSL